MKIKKISIRYGYSYHGWNQVDTEEIIWGYLKLMRVDPRYISDVKTEIINGLISPVKICLKDI